MMTSIVIVTISRNKSRLFYTFYILLTFVLFSLYTKNNVSAFISLSIEIPMNSADKKINELHQAILHIDPSSLERDEWKNCQWDLLVCLLGDYINDIYRWELTINLKPGEKDFSEGTVSSRSMERKHREHAHSKRFQVIKDPVHEILLVEKWRSSLYTWSKENVRKYPRARYHDSIAEQIKTDKAVVHWVNILQKLLLTPASTVTVDQKQNHSVDLMKFL